MSLFYRWWNQVFKRWHDLGKTTDVITNELQIFCLHPIVCVGKAHECEVLLILPGHGHWPQTGFLSMILSHPAGLVILALHFPCSLTLLTTWRWELKVFPYLGSQYRQGWLKNCSSIFLYGGVTSKDLLEDFCYWFFISLDLSEFPRLPRLITEPIWSLP